MLIHQSVGALYGDCFNCFPFNLYVKTSSQYIKVEKYKQCWFSCNDSSGAPFKLIHLFQFEAGAAIISDQGEDNQIRFLSFCYMLQVYWHDN